MPEFPAQTLTGKYISQSYHRVVQSYTPTGATFYLLNGTGSAMFSFRSASFGQELVTSNMTVTSSLSASLAAAATSASFATTSSFSARSVSASYALSASSFPFPSAFTASNIYVSSGQTVTGSLGISGSLDFENNFHMRISESLFVIQNPGGGGTVEITDEGEVRANSIIVGTIYVSSVSASSLVATDINSSLIAVNPSVVYGITASNAVSASNAQTASLLLGSVTSASYAGTASVLLGSVTSASYALSASHADMSDTASFLVGTGNLFVQGGNSFGTSGSLGTNDNNALVLKANTTESLYVNSNGRVSIGTGSAERTLHVVGNGIISERAGSPQLVLRRTSPLSDWQLSVGATSFQLANVSASTTQTPLTVENLAPDNSVFVRDNGNVGIGTNQPTTKLHVGGAISASSYTGKVIGTLTTLNAASTMSIDFDASMFQSASLSSSVYLTGSNPGVGKMASLKISASAGINVYYPAPWVWLGTAPTFISASKTAVISLTCYGSTDGDFVGAYATQL